MPLEGLNQKREKMELSDRIIYETKETHTIPLSIPNIFKLDALLTIWDVGNSKDHWVHCLSKNDLDRINWDSDLTVSNCSYYYGFHLPFSNTSCSTIKQKLKLHICIDTISMSTIAILFQ